MSRGVMELDSTETELETTPEHTQIPDRENVMTLHDSYKPC